MSTWNDRLQYLGNSIDVDKMLHQRGNIFVDVRGIAWSLTVSLDNHWSISGGPQYLGSMALINIKYFDNEAFFKSVLYMQLVVRPNYCSGFRYRTKSINRWTNAIETNLKN